METHGRGYSFALFYRRSLKGYVLLGLVFAFALTVIAQMELWLMFYGIVGCACGVLLRDIGWVREIRKNWPFSHKVTDWEKVRRIAERNDEARE